MELPTPLVDQVRAGRAILLLGSGASLDSSTKDGLRAPTTGDLTDLLVDAFLSPEHAGTDLRTAAELAISERDLPTIQEAIADVLSELRPSPAHCLLPSFRWHGLATTNYDQLVETAYDIASTPSQELIPILSDRDKMEDALRGIDRLPYLKLHGCISRTRDSGIPFILTPDQYVTHRKHRESLFRTLQEWGVENVIIAVGHSLRDPDLRQVLLELDELGYSRPRYYIVGPAFTDQEKRFWEGRRITPLSLTFDEFMTSLDRDLPSPLRAIVTDDTDELPIERRLTRPLLPASRQYLAEGATFVHGGMQVDPIDPTSFYRGASPTWSGIVQSLDVRRRPVDSILYDLVLPNESDRQSPVEFCLLKAEAGAGKTLCLQRIAWEASIDADAICLYVSEHGYLDVDAIVDIARALNDRLYLFVDSTAEHVGPLLELLRRTSADNIRLTLITAERQNQWNVYCQGLEPYLTQEYRLPYLNEQEIIQLIALLEKHRSLGYLAQLPSEQRITEFEERAGRQLLVALLEATHGRPYEEILLDEFDRIVPEAAQSLYLTVCVLNRLNLPVRAGVISRVHNIAFTAFREHMLLPLEHVVRVDFNKRAGDFVYTTRHSVIAQVIFERILNTPQRRFDEYSRLLRALNLGYSTDEIAFRHMTRGRTVLELFPDPEEARAIFDIAHRSSPDDPHLMHQQGLYEMNRPNSDHRVAHTLLKQAADLRPHDHTLVHSLAELERRRGDSATTAVAKRKHRDEAVRLARLLPKDSVHGPFGYHTILKTQLDRLKEALASEGAPDIEIERLIADAEEELERALQQFPDDEYLLAGESEFAQLLDDDERARASLRKAFDRSKRSAYVASRLARSLERGGDPEEALQVLREGINANEGNKQLNFAYAMLLRRQGLDKTDTVLHYLRRSFVPGDTNYEAQFWFAVYQFIGGQEEGLRLSQDAFAALRRAPLRFHERIRIRAMFPASDGKSATFRGVVRSIGESYGWIRRDGTGDDIMVHENNVGSTAWSALDERQLVSFEIGFCFTGPVVTKVDPLTVDVDTGR